MIEVLKLNKVIYRSIEVGEDESSNHLAIKFTNLNLFNLNCNQGSNKNWSRPATLPIVIHARVPNAIYSFSFNLRISPFYKIKDSHSFFLQVVVNASKLWV
jgi:hypothetical protein